MLKQKVLIFLRVISFALFLKYFLCASNLFKNFWALPMIFVTISLLKNKSVKFW